MVLGSLGLAGKISQALSQTAQNAAQGKLVKGCMYRFADYLKPQLLMRKLLSENALNRSTSYVVFINHDRL